MTVDNPFGNPHEWNRSWYFDVGEGPETTDGYGRLLYVIEIIVSAHRNEPDPDPRFGESWSLYTTVRGVTDDGEEAYERQGGPVGWLVSGAASWNEETFSQALTHTRRCSRRKMRNDNVIDFFAAKAKVR
jgi:hypothetical protein